MSRVHQENFSSPKNEPTLSPFRNLYLLYHMGCHFSNDKIKKNDGSGVPVNILLLHKVKLQQK